MTVNAIVQKHNTAVQKNTSYSVGISQSVQDSRSSTTISIKNSWPQYLGALVFGAVIVWAVGFLPTDIAHNAAHDTRHSFAFPCH